MAKANVSPPSLTILSALRDIVKHIEAVGQPTTATTLKRSLGIDPKTFNAAIEHGVANKYLKWGAHNYYSVAKTYEVPEEAYYALISEALEALWVRDGHERANFYIENTSRRDSKIEGQWTRPDLTLVSHKRFSWTIGTEFDVVTFEIKRPDNANVLAVFEALSHVTAATRAYVVFPVDAEGWRSANPAQERRVRDECVRHGVGLILVAINEQGPFADHVLRASRREIDHEKCSDFLDAVLTPAGKKRISEWKS